MAAVKPPLPDHSPQAARLLSSPSSSAKRGGMDKKELPDPRVGANTPISQIRKGEIASTPPKSPPTSQHLTKTSRQALVSRTNLATTPNEAVLPSSVADQTTKSLQLEEVDISGGQLLDKQVDSGDDIDNQRLRWEAIEEEQQVWDAMDAQLKSSKKDEKRRKQDDRNTTKENKKKRKLEVELKGKELEEKRKKPAKIREPNMIREEVRRSPSATRSPLPRLPLVGSPGINMLRSRIGILASAAASKRGRSSVRAENSPSEQTARSPSPSTSPSPTTSKNVHSRGRKRRRLTSAVWKDFNPRYEGGKLVEAQCKHCDEFLPAGRDMGTSGVRRHLATCEIRSDLHLMVEKLRSSTSSPHASVIKNWEFDQKTSRRLLARMIILDELPFSVVEYSGFKEFVKSLNPLFNMVSRNTVKDDCMQLHYEKKSIYCQGFKIYKGRVSLTSDMWTSNQTLGYMCITCHFIDAKWKLQKKIIRFCMLETPHNGVAMFNVLLKTLQDWNIEDKIFSITVDNASVNGVMISNLRENLVSKNMLHYEGQLLHIRCACHVLNLIVQDGLSAMKPVVDNIRESVKFVKSSQTRLDKFKEVVARVGISCKLYSCDLESFVPC